MITAESFDDVFTQDVLKELFPEDRSNQFFDALFGDPNEGAYDISLKFKEYDRNELRFELHLKSRPGKCLACNLTVGLPKVFGRHPIINIEGLVKEIDRLLNGKSKCLGWRLGQTMEISADLHFIPLSISLADRP